ncbi:MAG TPA: ABC transporter permease [Luteibaculaceae bacterium]|nr:ABC transporter permease [Luteibaculaceae bacterium]
MGKIRLIIAREYLTRVKKKSFLLMTFFGPLLMAGIFVGAIAIGLAETSEHDVLVVDKTPGKIFTGKFENLDDIKYHYSDKDLSNEEFQKSPYTMMLYLNEKTVEMDAGELFYSEAPGFTTQGKIQHQIEGILEEYKLSINNISREQYESINTEFNLVTKDIEKNTDDSYKELVSGVGFAFAVVIYMFIFIYGVQVMRGVMEEKSNRIVEVLISSVKPFELMMGKIVGIALVGLTQFVLWIALTFTLVNVGQIFLLDGDDVKLPVKTEQITGDAAKELAKLPTDNADLSTKVYEVIDRINVPLMLGMFLFYFLGGFLVYASLFAAIGAAVDNESDSQQFMMPITIPLIFGFIIAEMSMVNPGGTAVTWFSIVPLTSPVVMMVRLAQGFDSSTVWQLIVSMVSLVAFFLFCVWLAAKIYRTGILMYGKKVTYKELWKWLRYNG